MNIKNLVGAVALAAVSSTSFAATIVFSDNFNANTAGGNKVPTGWNVSGGTVDIVGPTPYYFGNLCATGGQDCIDLDGSTGLAGTLSKTLNLTAGRYELSFDLRGNNRSGSDSVVATFGTQSTAITNLAYNAGWSTYLLSYTHLGNGPVTLSFKNAGGDNVGALLDNVSVSAVPIPAALPLMASGLGMLGFFGARRKKKEAIA